MRPLRRGRGPVPRPAPGNRRGLGLFEPPVSKMHPDRLPYMDVRRGMVKRIHQFKRRMYGLKPMRKGHNLKYRVPKQKKKPWRPYR